MRRLRRLCTQAHVGTVAVAVSGGVDSSVALHLLKAKGFAVEGVHMRNWDPQDEDPGACTADQDREDAAAVCAQVGVPFREVSFVKEYWNRIFEPLLQDYSAGLVPNPDVACNREIKFGALYNHVRSLGYSHLATGHYARVRHCRTGTSQLVAGIDGSKDQSYFLSTIPQHALQHAMFPLGELYKHETRAVAMEAGLATATKRESMGLCFVGKRRNFRHFLQAYMEVHAGAFVSEHGMLLGQHEGSSLYTIGQKANIGGQTQKWYVVGKDVSTNVVIVGEKESPRLLSTGLTAFPPSWIAGVAPDGISEGAVPMLCRFRHGQHLLPAMVRHPPGDGEIHLSFQHKQHAVQPGQVVAFYSQDGSICLGGATIRNTWAACATAPESWQYAIDK